MMQMLEAGGMLLLTDEIRKPDENNPRGYFEYEPVKRTRRDASWVAAAQGKAVKVIYALLSDLPSGFDYRVILMRRPIAEVVASQQAMLESSQRHGSTLSADHLAAAMAADLDRIIAEVSKRPDFRTLELGHRQCLDSPQTAAMAVNEFLDRSLNADRMAKIPERSLYRQRR